jgi:cytochrome c biogenesis protein CcmG/thiol:disulfide interchange protein DsbE
MIKVILKTVLILAVVTIACGSKEQVKQSDTGDFVLPSIDGAEYTLSQFKGQVVVIDFWATWCPPCRNSIPAFITLYDKYHEQGFTILGISLDTDEQALRNYSAQMQIPYPVLIGNKDVARSYQVSGIPKTIFLDKKGKIRKTQVGFAPELEAQFDQFISSLLEE